MQQILNSTNPANTSPDQQPTAMTEPCSTPRFFDFLLDDEPSLLFGTDCTSVVDSVGDWIFRDPADDDTAAAAMQRHDSHINVGPTPSPAQRRRKATTPATPAATTGSPRRQCRATDPRIRNKSKAADPADRRRTGLV